MTAAAAAARGRLLAESMMSDTVTVTRYGSQTWVEATGVETRPVASTPYVGRCRVRPGGGGGTAEAGEEAVAVWPFILSLPASATGVQLDDEAVLSASADPALVGVRLRVMYVFKGTDITARRLGCEEVESS